jgi:hypothetical protein
MPSHYGERNSDSISLDFHLIVSDGKTSNNPWGRPSVRITAGPPALKRNERAINLRMKLPAALFETPTIQATINVAADQPRIELNAEAISEAVRGAIGMDVELQVVDQHGQVVS